MYERMLGYANHLGLYMENHGPFVRMPPGGRYEIEEPQALCDVAS
jgi:hypothetical protein